MILKNQPQLDSFDESRKKELERSICQAKENAIKSFQEAFNEARSESDKQRLKECIERLKNGK